VTAVAERFYAGAYWAARREDAAACAERLVRFLDALSQISPLLGEWFELGERPASARQRLIPRTIDPIRGLLLDRRGQREGDEALVDTLGFSAGMWNGQEADAGLRVRCGSDSAALGNAVALTLPAAGGLGIEVYQPLAALHIMRALAECWEPDWATLTSHALRRAQGPPPRSLVVGWMTYMAAPRHVDATRLPEQASVEDLAAGTLITIGSEVTAVTEELVLAVREALGEL
jgi:Immunity protein 52